MGNSTLSEISKAQLSANTTLSNATNSANNEFNTINSQADEDIDTLVSSAFDKLRSIGFNGVTGLELGKVKNMKDSISEYVKGIQDALAPLNSSDATEAFGPRMHQAIEQFVVAVKNSCNALISNMESFNKDLDAVYKSMEAKAQTVNTSVGKTTDNLTSSASSWKYGAGESN